eukprot:m.20644 g.20644  ORF g.20644 m.20644 type:complete len:77 (-) comp32186_c1_seq1:48-278(-)
MSSAGSESVPLLAAHSARSNMMHACEEVVDARRFFSNSSLLYQSHDLPGSFLCRVFTSLRQQSTTLNSEQDLFAPG